MAAHFTYRMAPGVLVCFLLFNNGIGAQQVLNMDFEKVSSKNVTQPWGWEPDIFSPDLVTSLDSAMTHHGKYSLALKNKVDAVTSGAQAIVFYLEPYSITGKTVKFEGWVRSENFEGSLVIKLEDDKDFLQAGIAAANDSVKFQKTGNLEWRKFTFFKKISPGINWTRLIVTHSGKGNVWIDDMALYVASKKITALPVAIPFTRQQMNWLNTASSSLTSVDASKQGGAYSYNDLEKFKKIAGDALIIGLGEATHGTSEFFRMKHRAVEYAVKEMGVRVFGIEDHQLIVENVNRYVLSGKGDARKSMYGMFGVWDSEEVLNLVKWVRSYNEQHPDDMVEFVGYDMQSVNQPLDSLYSFWLKMDTVFFASIKNLFTDLKKNLPAVYSATDSMKQVWSTDAKRLLDLTLQKKQGWLAKCNNKNDSLYIEWGAQYARLVQQFARENINPMALYRDEAMAENISWILSIRKPGTKILIWAHDVHISRGEHPERELNYHHGISMGSWLAKKYGTRYKAFGLATYTGAYRAYPGYDDYSHWMSCPVYPGPPGTLDFALHKITEKRKVPALLLDLTNSRQQKWLSTPLPVRFANHVCYEYAYWTRFSVPYQFDGIFFIDKTNPAKQIK